MSDNHKNIDYEIVRKEAEQLAEHFDTVQIFVTRHMPAELNGTRTVTYGIGNWYARHGQVSLWITEGTELERARARDDYERRKEP